MFQSYADIQYDERTQRLNRRIKVVTAIGIVLVFAAIAVAASKVDVAVGPQVLNDTRGTMSCVHLDSNDNRVFADYLRAGEERRIIKRTACSVFDDKGDYAGCLVIRSDASNDQKITASAAERRVKADFCAYPR